MKCKRCGKKRAKRGYRFCSPCIDALRVEMEATGYLTSCPSTRHHKEASMDIGFVDDEFADDGDNLSLTVLHAYGYS